MAHHNWKSNVFRTRNPRYSQWLVLLLFLIATIAYWSPPKSRQDSTQATFRGNQYWKDGVTLSSRTLYETPFSRFQLHSVKIESNIINDWLWYDESDNVNVLVQQGDHFLIMSQTKYAIPGPSLAVVGGLIEPGETPLQAAQREVREELGYQASNWKSLGQFVAAANRGGGTTHIFWAMDAKPLRQSHDGEIALGELEKQHLIRFTKSELLEALLQGKFREIKWTATVALALLSSDDGNMH